MKKLLCILSVLLIIFQAVPLSSALVPEGMEGPKDTAQLAERLYKLMEEYPSGSYFTKNGQSCNGHVRGIANCIEVTAEQAGTAGNRQCFGFARMVFWHLYGKPFGHYNSAKNWLPNGSEMENVTTVWSADPGTRLQEEAVRQAFGSAMIGDFVQCGIPHSMTFLQMEEGGILVYDADYEMSTCRVLVHLVEWDVLIKWIRRYGMSYYRAVNYPQTVNHAPFSYEAFNGGNVANIKITAHPDAEPVLYHSPDLTGLELTYTYGSKVCTLTCTEKDTFQMSGAFGDRQLTSGSDDEYAPQITCIPASGNLVGSVQIRFLDTTAVLVCPVEKREPKLLSATGPTRIRYRVGDTFDPAGACITVLDEDLNTREFRDGDIRFSEVDFSKPGEYVVSMEAYGLSADPFTVTVIREEDPFSQSEEDPPVSGSVRILVTVLIVLAAAVLLLFGIRSVNRSKRKSRSRR